MMWLAEHSLRVAALVVVVGTGSFLARRASAHSRLFAWTVVLYIAAAMPLFGALLPDIPVPIALGAPVIVVPGPDSVVNNPVSQMGAGPAVSESPAALPWFVATYVMVAGFLVTRLTAGMRQTTRVVRRARPTEDATLAAEVQALSSAMRLSRVPGRVPERTLRIVQHASVHVPFVCGLWRPVLVLPDSWDCWDAATRRAVLTHELSHIVRRDLWTLRAASLYRAATWINPLSWWLRRKIATLADRASDEAVLATGVEPTAYAEVLVQFFDAAQRAPGRASWQLAMARRGAMEARKRVGRVLNAREGGNVRFGMPGRVVVGVAVILAAVPVVALSASRLDAIAIQAPAIADLGLDLRHLDELRVTPSTVEGRQSQVTVMPSQRQVKRSLVAVDVTIPQQAQEQEPEPWRSTRKATGADVVAPVATITVTPKYTADAMRAKIQGMVAVEVIISPEGNVTAARVIKSLDKDFGLDDEALKVARQWKFLPGTYQGQPVAMRVMIDLEFRLH